MLNLANPDRAFHLAQLPSDGVGLVRIEFVVSSWIGVHPMALLHPERVTDEAAAERDPEAGWEASIRHPSSSSSRLASGVAQIAAAFYPRPVIVRFSDFKTNEYAGLLGGRDFEPVESNPMIGFRGASRYYDERYREAFALECAAIRRVREEMGLTNVKVMIPFCRTLEEGRRVLRRDGGERPAFGERTASRSTSCARSPTTSFSPRSSAELFDGFSIGSNDLTQLALGVDRDSELLREAVRRAGSGGEAADPDGHRRGAPERAAGRHLRPGAERLPRVRRLSGADRDRFDIAQSRLARQGSVQDCRRSG